MSLVDGRLEHRYTVLRRLTGSLGNIEVVLDDIGEHGFHVRHEPALRLATEARLTFTVPDDGSLVALQSFVVWSRFGSPGDPRPYHSGLRVDDGDGVLKQAIATLLEGRVIQPDEESMRRKQQQLEERARARQSRVKVTSHAPRIPDDVILLVKQARARLQANPAEIVRWFNRAKFSLNEAGEQIHQRDDVLAVWEYLERSVELSIIARVLDER